MRSNRGEVAADRAAGVEVSEAGGLRRHAAHQLLPRAEGGQAPGHNRYLHSNLNMNTVLQARQWDIN